MKDKSEGASPSTQPSYLLLDSACGPALPTILLVWDQEQPGTLSPPSLHLSNSAAQEPLQGSALPVPQQPHPPFSIWASPRLSSVQGEFSICSAHHHHHHHQYQIIGTHRPLLLPSTLWKCNHAFISWPQSLFKSHDQDSIQALNSLLNIHPRGGYSMYESAALISVWHWTLGFMS